MAVQTCSPRSHHERTESTVFENATDSDTTELTYAPGA